MSTFDLRNAMFLDGAIIAIGGLRGNAPNPGGGGGGPTGPITRDGHISWAVSNSATITSGGTTLVTTLTNNLLIAAIESSRGSAAIATVSSVTSTSGLIWTRVGGISGPVSSGSKQVNLEIWTAWATSILSGEQVIFHLTGTVPCNCAGVVAMHGVVGSSGIYTLDGVPLTNLAANSGHPSVTLSTTYTNDVIIFAAGGVAVASNNAAPTGFTSDTQTQNSYTFFSGTLGLSHHIVAGAQTGLLLQPSGGTGIGACMAFALKGS